MDQAIHGVLYLCCVKVGLYEDGRGRDGGAMIGKGTAVIVKTFGIQVDISGLFECHVIVQQAVAGCR
jgi:hypothetical protein